MIRLQHLRGMAETARLQSDPEIAHILNTIADARALAVREQLGGNPGWLSTTDVPEGEYFRPATEGFEFAYRKVDGLCEAQSPGRGRFYCDHIDLLHPAGFIEVRP